MDPWAVVTGATGFIGTALCRRLQAEGRRVRAVSRRPRSGPWDEHVAADLAAGPLDAAVMRGAAVVYHLAGRAHALTDRPDDETPYLRANVEATRRVLDAARASGVRRLVFASSVKAMGEGDALARDEACPPRPVSPYGRSKLAAERLVLGAQDARFGASVLRPALVYGPGAGGNVGRLLTLLDRGWLPAFGLPENARSMVDLRDVAEAFLLCEGPAARGRVYLLTDGEDYSTERVMAAMREALGHPRPRLRVPYAALRALAAAGDGLGRLLGRRMPFDGQALQRLAGSARYDASLIGRELGFVPKWTLERALPEMVAARRAWRAAERTR